MPFVSAILLRVLFCAPNFFAFLHSKFFALSFLLVLKKFFGFISQICYGSVSNLGFWSKGALAAPCGDKPLLLESVAGPSGTTCGRRGIRQIHVL